MKKWTFLLLLIVVLTDRISVLVNACGGDHVDGDHLHHHEQYFNETHFLRTRRNLQDDDFDDCGFSDPSSEELKADAERMRQHKVRNGLTTRAGANGATVTAYAKIYQVPVAFHIIQPDLFTGFVSRYRVDRYVAYLNAAFAASNTPFVFVLKNITRTFNSSWASACGNSAYEAEYKRQLKQGGKETMNVYLCTAIGGSTTGFSYLPFQNSDTFLKDGIVLAERSVDDKRLSTLVHETGHWFGLLHTFGDNTCDPSSAGDLVDDTPQHISRSSTVNCHSDPSGWDTCPNLPGIDPIRNYMTYSSDNLCRTQFTLGQVKRMVAQYEIYRKTSSDQSRPVPAPRPAPTKSPTSPPVLHIVDVDPPGPDCLGYFKRCQTSSDCCTGICVNYLSSIIPGICWWKT